jgi:DNA-binding SARP family transcriptional activator
MSATRDEALEALWPELGPDTAGNSLHQTIYFLRRVFEPAYREGLSAEYVGFDGDVISLNPSLVDTSSRRVWRLVNRGQRVATVRAADELLAIYTGRYALDFAYEDWAAPYRDNLHAAVLSSVEATVTDLLARDDLDGVIRISRTMLTVDPTADAIELQLLLAYKASGRRAAAAEQYAHYAAVLRDELGIEPPRLDEI